MPLAFDLRPAAKSDLAFCWPIYRDAMKPLTEALARRDNAWDEPAQRHIVEQAVVNAGTSIVRSDGGDAGWVQVEESQHVVMLRQIFLLPMLRNRGLGTSFLTWMKERAERKRKDLTLEVMPNNPALHLYERLGFKPVTTSDSKITMRY
jgi:ribosomal protein S18 acetylase RimI-like enzyme